MRSGLIPAPVERHRGRADRRVFVVATRPAKLLRLRTQLIGLIDQGTDSVLFCDLGTLRDKRCMSLDVIGRGRTITDHGPAILYAPRSLRCPACERVPVAGMFLQVASSVALMVMGAGHAIRSWGR